MAAAVAVAMGAPRPAFVFVGGVSHTPVFFDSIRQELHRAGFASSAVSYATVGHDTVGRTFDDDVKAIQDAVSDFADGKDQDVVLVCHSYGGWPGSRAVKGWDKQARMKAGKKYGIVELVFVAAFLLPDNAVTATYSVLPDWLTVENGVRLPNEKAMPMIFSDLSPEQQRYWFSKFEPQRNDFGGLTVPNAPWAIDSLQKTYIMTMDDHTAVSSFQLHGLSGVIDATWSLKSIRSGHEPFLSQPQNFAKVLLEPTV